MNQCETCECDRKDCINCWLGNPCIGCTDYDPWNDKCESEGACGDQAKRGRLINND